MADILEDLDLIRYALAYVDALYRELSAENGAATLGLQNQAVDLIRTDPGLRAAVTAWGRSTNVDEASMAPPRRLPRDAAYARVRDFLAAAMGPPVFRRRQVGRP